MPALVREGLEPGDVVVVTQKIISKAEGQVIRLSDVKPGERARELAAITLKDPRLVELVLAESESIVRAVPHVLLTRHRLGLVMANAGIDCSNIGPGTDDRALLLPRDPDASARAIRAGLKEEVGIEPAVLISDSFGRPWRMGVVNVCIGSAGFDPLIDRRGEPDREGRSLQVTQIAIGDLIASAAGLAMGEGAEGIPAVLIKGLKLEGDGPASNLIRPTSQDLFQ